MAAIASLENESPFVRKMAMLDPAERAEVIEALPYAVRKRLRFSWSLWARPGQLWRPGPETYTVLLGGRGSGKSRPAMHAVDYVAARPELCGGFIGIAGRTTNEVNNTMVRAMLACIEPSRRPRWIKSDKMLVWKNGVEARLFSGEDPESFRGPNVGFMWCDELAYWARLVDCWDTATKMCRVGEHARFLISTTPTGVETIERLVWEFYDTCPGVDDDRPEPIPANDSTPLDRVFQGFLVREGVRVVNFRTFDNAANLAPNFIHEMRRLEGTAAYDQEINGMILRGVPGALWKHEWIRRVERLPPRSELVQVVVGVDPSGGDDSRTSKNAEVGIVVAGIHRDGTIYILEDCSARLSPEAWGARVWMAFDRWDADEIAVEANNGGDNVLAVLRLTRPHKNVSDLVRRVDATRNKAARAKRVIPLYERGRVLHCGEEIGTGPAQVLHPSSSRFAVLERQMTSWDPNKPLASQGSPDRVDALVWSLLWLTNGGSDRRQVKAMGSKATWDEVRRQLERRSR